MKKHFILGAIALGVSLSVVSCSSRDGEENISENSTTKNNSINPPAWIRGTWVQSHDDYNIISYTFTSNNIIQDTGGIKYSFKEVEKLGGYRQTSSNNKFTFTIGNDESLSTSITFIKIDNKTIRREGIMPIYFYKK